MRNQQIPLTKEGLERLESELHDLRTTRRVEVANEIREDQQGANQPRIPCRSDIARQETE
jgi:hypothetical protein